MSCSSSALPKMCSFAAGEVVPMPELLAKRCSVSFSVFICSPESPAAKSNPASLTWS